MKLSIKLDSTSLTLQHEGDKPIPLQRMLCELEKAVIGALLKRNNGIKARVAAALSFNRTTLVEKAKKYGFPLKKMSDEPSGV